MWRRLADRPLGKRLFSAAVMARAPYFGTILPTVETMVPGRCEVRAPKWWGVHNHIGTFHAIAACNLAEIAMGMLAEATVPPSHRWIPKGMTVSYLAKAKSGLRATASLVELPEFGDEPFELTVPVAIRDRADAEVVHADITIWITRHVART
ncbi:MAG: hotdog fold domain-containing protein [Actinophytocola sp.]|uniref:hotdog fold domain-containing protein n=1 Tax=Actinophytocola sp. TaxID=1872138 RepID=UPI003D6B162C